MFSSEFYNTASQARYNISIGMDIITTGPTGFAIINVILGCGEGIVNRVFATLNCTL